MLIYLEGNIGGGKSTLINFLNDYINSNNINADVILEPVEEWENTQDIQGTNILQHYYQDQKKYGFAFQINALLSRVKKIQEKISASKKYIHFVERSIFTDKNVFLECNYQNGNITHMEYVIYQQWFDWILENFKLRPDGYVFLNTDTQICYERIKERSRTGEECIPLEYLDMLDKLHRSWLSKEIPYKVQQVETNHNFYLHPEKKEEEIKKIMDFVDKLERKRINFC